MPRVRSTDAPACWWLRVVVPFALMAVIFYLSAQPAPAEHMPIAEVLARKAGHVTGYLLLTLAWWWALRPRLHGAWKVAAVVAVLYAISDELHQLGVPTRHGTPVDVLIDSIGIGIASIAASGYD